MSFFRRRLPRWAAAWLVLQAGALGTLVATDCCVTRPAVATDQQACHKRAPAPHCPMPRADGSPCPMHRGAGQDSASTAASCSLRGTCSEPMAALAALLWNQGVLTDPSDLLPDEGIGAAALSAHQPLVARPDAPNSPPPRA